MPSDDIVLMFKRHCIADLPDRLDASTKKISDADLRIKVAACASLFREWLKHHGNDIRCQRPETSWRWLAGAAKQAGAYTASLLIETKLLEREARIEREEEERDRERRTALALAEYRAGGGE